MSQEPPLRSDINPIMKLNGKNMLIRGKRKFKTKYTKRTIDDDLVVKSKFEKKKFKPDINAPTKGERLIADFLTLHKIKFSREKMFGDLRSPFTTVRLRLDFYLHELRTAIEFDGIQHFEVCKRWNMSEYDLYRQQTKDRTKDIYCAEKGIRMIRIHYKQINKISEVLSELLL